MARLTPDICVIGGGQAGFAVAAAAAAFGADVVLVEKAGIGGARFGRDLPRQALLAAASRARDVAEAERFGIRAGAPQVDLRRVRAHVDAAVAARAPEVSPERCRALGIAVIEAEASFADRRTVIAGEQEIAARRFVIATGTVPRVPEIAGLDAVGPVTSEALLERGRVPKHLLIVGGGATGLELAQAWRRLGASVTVVEANRVLDGEDPELAAIVLDRLRAEGVQIRETARAVAVAPRGKTGMRLTCETPEGSIEIDGSDLLLATGYAPAIDALDLEAVGIRFGPDGIEVRASLGTRNPRVYAIGGAAARMPCSAAAVEHQASLVVRQILFRQRIRLDSVLVPHLVSTDPGLARVGLSEDEARARHGARISVLRWPFAENDSAVAGRETAGHIKLVLGRKGDLLGAAIVGAGAGEAIGVWALALQKGLNLSDMRDWVPTAPSRGEIGKRAAVSYYASVTRKRAVRRLVRFLRRFG
jgi:Pyruvate/2-oxoglutarate dehydrogenase complex, dihydrolipoamide dehydrogenase (E3) component, and related enzymes